MTTKLCLIVACLTTVFMSASGRGAGSAEPCCIQIVDSENGWPVPMVELVTIHHVKFVSDNAGRVAFDLPELMGRETWLNVTSDGYEVKADGFGMRGKRITPQAGETIKLEVNRTSIAKRLGRVTGAGLFGESQKLGMERDWTESGVLGSDSVQNAVYNGRRFWAWGDTSLARYPLGIFDTSCATTSLTPLARFEPPLRLKLNYFTDSTGLPRGVAKMPGSGPTWIFGLACLPDRSGKERLVTTYIKVKPPMEAYETGLCVWDDKSSRFEQLRVIWTKSDATPKQPPMPEGHPVTMEDEDGKKWLLFGNPLPRVKCPATFEGWQDPSQWEILEPQKPFVSASDGTRLKPASGAVAWNTFRNRWVTVFLQEFGSPSAYGEVWYAEAHSPTGPWGKAVKVLSHKNYAFYNVQIHGDLTPAKEPFLLFEGTHSQTFANNPVPTPRYDYNQIMYRLDLDDPGLKPAQQ